MDNISEQVLAQGVRTLRGGSGPLVVLLPGWPQTAEAYDDLFPRLTAQHQVLALDPPGLGESAPSSEGYDTARISRTLAAAVEGVATGRTTLLVMMSARGSRMPGRRSFLSDSRASLSLIPLFPAALRRERFRFRSTSMSSSGSSRSTRCRSYRKS